MRLFGLVDATVDGSDFPHFYMSVFTSSASAPSAPTDTVGRVVSAFSPGGSVYASTPSGSAQFSAGSAQINASI